MLIIITSSIKDLLGIYTYSKRLILEFGFFHSIMGFFKKTKICTKFLYVI